MLLEASQEGPARFVSFGLSRIFTEDTDSGVHGTTFSEYQTGECWPIETAGG